MAQTYYIFRSGRLRRKQNTLYLEKKGEDGEVQRHPIPVENVRDIYLLGEVDLNTKLLNFLGRNGVVLHCFSYYGFYSGSFYPRETNVSGHLLVCQVQHYLDPEKRMEIAREIVSAALFNLRRNLLYYKNRGKEVGENISLVEKEMMGVEVAKDIKDLMGIEGRCRDTYYRAFNQILDLEAPFVKRVRRPPDNMINALISFGNSLLYTATLSEIYKTHLNPTISYLHEPGERRFSLALDISEIFKPLIVDRIIFRVLNKGMIEEGDFESVGEAGGVYLGEGGRKVFIQEFEKQLQTTVQHRRLKRNVSYRQLIRLEAYKLIRHLLGMERYKGLKAWW